MNFKNNSCYVNELGFLFFNLVERVGVDLHGDGGVQLY